MPVPLTVNELYTSILGESSQAGRPCILIRLTGCNLRCRWCDSTFSFYGGVQRSVEELVNEVQQSGVNLVLITGGEPLLQPEAFTLIDRLINEGYQVMVETNGAIDLAPLNPQAIAILDIKCPGSGESEKMKWENLHRLRPHDEVKFVLSDRQDYEWARQVIAEYDLTAHHEVLLSPAFGLLQPRQLAEWILADRLPVRLQLQIHKFIWEPGMRGV